MKKVLKLLCDLKRKYEEKIGPCTYEPDKDAVNHTCVNRWVKELDEPYFNARFSGIKLWQYQNFVNFRYSNICLALDENGETVQFDNFFDLYEGLYQDCRGIVLDVKKEGIVLLPFKKFWNLNEREETSLSRVRERMQSAKEVEFSDKMDGSMISAGIYEGKVIMSASGCNNPKESVQMREAMRMMLDHPSYKDLLYSYPDDTHIFELISPFYDPHIVAYKEAQEGLYLVGIRNRKTGKEASYKEVLERAKNYNVKATTVFSKTLDEVLASLDEKKAGEAEGFVLNIDGFKVKIKYEDYTKIHRLIDSSISASRIVQIMEDGMFDDVYAQLPDVYKSQIKEQRDSILSFVGTIDGKINGYLGKVDSLPKKEAMLKIDKEIPVKYRPFVREKYIGRPVSYLKNRAGHYRTIKELKKLAE